MSIKMQQSHHLVALRFNEQIDSRKGSTSIPKLLLLWVLLVAFISMLNYKEMDGWVLTKLEESKFWEVCVTRRQRCFCLNLVSVSNYVQALAILIYTFQYFKIVSAIDQENVFRFLSFISLGQLGLRVRDIIHFSCFSQKLRRCLDFQFFQGCLVVFLGVFGQLGLRSKGQ